MIILVFEHRHSRDLQPAHTTGSIDDDARLVGRATLDISQEVTEVGVEVSIVVISGYLVNIVASDGVLETMPHRPMQLWS